ncbi:MAG: YHYH protein [Balneola sp.]|nr:MAG: YHYH protein [Balneola sp.]
MKRNRNLFLAIMLPGILLVGCSTDSDSDEEIEDSITYELPAAFSAFSTDNVTAIIDGSEVVIETNGLPNHTSPYWSQDHELFVEPTVTSFDQMAPGTIDQFNGSYTLRVPVNPTKAANSTSTGLGAIGIAVSGAVIYNDQEGPNVPLDDAVVSLDYTAAHTGPQSYHYHLEPKAWSDDDDELIGIIADGFLLYGRICPSTETYPTDLDESGGHTSITKYDSENESYHYHILNELYLNQYYILFPGDYQGTANAIN